jgi:hypothetical protein
LRIMTNKIVECLRSTSDARQSNQNLFRYRYKKYQANIDGVAHC